MLASYFYGNTFTIKTNKQTNNVPVIPGLIRWTDTASAAAAPPRGHDAVRPMVAGVPRPIIRPIE